jgi:hypothetical protein
MPLYEVMSARAQSIRESREASGLKIENSSSRVYLEDQPEASKTEVIRHHVTESYYEWEPSRSSAAEKTVRRSR